MNFADISGLFTKFGALKNKRKIIGVKQFLQPRGCQRGFSFSYLRNAINTTWREDWSDVFSVLPGVCEWVLDVSKKCSAIKMKNKRRIKYENIRIGIR